MLTKDSYFFVFIANSDRLFQAIVLFFPNNNAVIMSHVPGFNDVLS